MSWRRDWKLAFKELKQDREGDENVFGPNCWHDDKEVKRYISKLERLGAEVEIDAGYWESIKVHLPHSTGDMVKQRNILVKQINILIHILTTAPTPTESLYNRKKNYLELTWS